MSRLSHFGNFIQTLTISKKDYETHKKLTCNWFNKHVFSTNIHNDVLHSQHHIHYFF